MSFIIKCNVCMDSNPIGLSSTVVPQDCLQVLLVSNGSKIVLVVYRVRSGCVLQSELLSSD